MTELIATTVNAPIVPVPRGGPIATRLPTMDDLPFMDALQKRYHKQLGFFPRAQMEGYVRGGHVLLAEASVDCGMLNVEGPGVNRASDADDELLRRSTINNPHSPTRVGYVISRDRYLKRDELGVIYQLCVAPGHQRGLIGATLVREVFARSAYGCLLYCCWCAQDLEANYFWESLGFVPIAFRAGSALRRRSGQGRVHIFWQRRVDADRADRADRGWEVGGGRSERKGESSNDPQPTTHNSRSAAPYWYPFQTSSGAIREDRIVFPIPPGVRWQDVKAVEVARATRPCLDQQRENMGGSPMPRKAQRAPVAMRTQITRRSALRFALPVAEAPPALPAPVEATKRPRERRPVEKIDPTYLQAARELRDRYLERLNETPHALVSCGKYDVSRALAPALGSVPPIPLASHSLPQLPVAA